MATLNVHHMKVRWKNTKIMQKQINKSDQIIYKKGGGKKA